MKLHRPLISAVCLAVAVAAQAQQHLVDVIYGHKMGVALTMDVFEPAKPNGIGVIWFVSGGWFSSHDDVNPLIAKPFTDRGMTVFEVVHGSQPKFQIPEILSDVNRAVRFIRVNSATWHVDPNRLGVSGGSAGGHLDLMIGAYGGPGDPNAKDPVDRASSAVEAIACFFPPTDMVNFGSPGREPFREDTYKPFWPAFGFTDKTSKEDMDKLAKDYSPIYGVTAKFPPTFVMHGDADKLVPLQQSQELMDKLQELGVPHKLVVKKGAGHGFWLGMDKDMNQFADWFEKYLGKAK
ncbi:MAG TPA: alpha/beta hydrolase [Fimbriimonadaceae bacterium]|nr:alpha/beta hydrolase [Fimbriimonadaceae bacterium]